MLLLIHGLFKQKDLHTPHALTHQQPPNAIRAKRHRFTVSNRGHFAEPICLHWQYNSHSISQLLERVLPLLNHQQAKLFLTQDQTLYGFASWVYVSEATHQQLLQDATWACAKPQLTELLSSRSKSDQPNYLWFIDLLTPFSHALTATADLKQQLSCHESAWALNINQGQHGPRQVW